MYVQDIFNNDVFVLKKGDVCKMYIIELLCNVDLWSVYKMTFIFYKMGKGLANGV